MMKEFLIAASAAAILAAGPALAADLEPGVSLGTSTTEIAAALQEQGYEIEKYERERGEIEVYASRDGRRWELTIDPRTGEMLRIREED